MRLEIMSISFRWQVEVQTDKGNNKKTGYGISANQTPNHRQSTNVATETGIQTSTMKIKLISPLCITVYVWPQTINKRIHEHKTQTYRPKTQPLKKTKNIKTTKTISMSL